MILLAGSVLAAGCTTAGPYVTNLSSDGRDGLTVEKCQVEFNAFMGVVSTKNCTTQTLFLNRAAATTTENDPRYQPQPIEPPRSRRP